MQTPFWLPTSPVAFPPTELALEEPNGLLAVGGNLTAEWLLQAYSLGIFPWYSEEDPILWWTPSPRAVLWVDKIKVRRSLKKVIRQQKFTVTLDQDFSRVIQHCAQTPRSGQDGTWILPEMQQAYIDLHHKGHAHSVEVWREDQLVGGLYGMHLGRVFFGESMFSLEADASKIALVALCAQLKAWGFRMIDVQMETPHLISMGAELISRKVFEQTLKHDTQLECQARKWQLNVDWQQAYFKTNG